MSHITNLFKLIILFASLLVIATGAYTTISHAHGDMQYPVGRSLGCYLDSPQDPNSLACKAWVQESTKVYDWDMVNQLPGAWVDDQNQLFDKHKEYVPDGTLCSGNKGGYEGLDAARKDWPVTIFEESDTASPTTFTFNATAPHKTNYFNFYITKDSYDYSNALNWDDLEATPFCESGEVPLENSATTSGDADTKGFYNFECQLPQDKEGQHIIYMVWQRDFEDSPEAFYSCADVIFGDPEVFATPTPSPAGSCAAETWVDGGTYTEDDNVLHNGKEYQAKWWTNMDEPGVDAFGAWEEIADCSNLPPTAEPATATPTMSATEVPTEEPTAMPVTEVPTEEPTAMPVTEVPTVEATPETTLVGDVNCDGRVSLVDVVLIQRHNSFLIGATNNCPEAMDNTKVYEPACDVNGDNKCGLVDALILLQCNAQIDNPFCTE